MHAGAGRGRDRRYDGKGLRNEGVVLKVEIAVIVY